MTDFWEAVIYSTWRDIRKLPKWKQPIGYLLVVAGVPFLYLVFLVISVLDIIHGE